MNYRKLLLTLLLQVLVLAGYFLLISPLRAWCNGPGLLLLAAIWFSVSSGVTGSVFFPPAEIFLYLADPFSSDGRSSGCFSNMACSQRNLGRILHSRFYSALPLTASQPWICCCSSSDSEANRVKTAA